MVMFQNQDRDLVELHLSKVSRSFALAIRVLEQPLQDWVGLSYLLFRILDTVEDSRWASHVDQKNAFTHFEDILTSNAAANGLYDFCENHIVENSATAYELALLKDMPKLMDLLLELPANIRSDIISSLLQMSRGMRYFVLRNWGSFKLANLEEVELYCYFVAGLVGELLTRLLYHSRSKAIEDTRLLNRSIELGLFLQKVNILKDQIEDEKIQRYLVPDRLGIRKSLLMHADSAIEYILKIHNESKSYALFCSLSLFLGMVSIPYIESSFKLSKLSKPSREITLQLFAQLQGMISNPEAILKFYQSLRAQLA